jgi:hypothetical protein
VCVVHVNVGPEIEHGAQGLATFLEHNGSDGGGYHHIIDDHEKIRIARDDQLVYGAKGGGANLLGLHYCIIGSADQTAQQWMDPYSVSAMVICADQIRNDCDSKSIAKVHTPGSFSGVCGHHDVTLAFHVVGGHYDPGTNFPWNYFMQLVNPPAPPTAWPFGDDMPKPTDVVDVLDNDEGLWKLTADGGVQAVRGPFHGSYPGLPPAARQGTRYFMTITANRGKAGYTLWGSDGASYSFPV